MVQAQGRLAKKSFIAALFGSDKEVGCEIKLKMAGIYRKSVFRNPVLLFAVLAIYFVVMPTQAYAYLDPDTGSFIFQILVGAVVGGIFFLKFYRLAEREDQSPAWQKTRR